MVKPEKFGHLHLVYHFTVPLRLWHLSWHIINMFIGFTANGRFQLKGCLLLILPLLDIRHCCKLSLYAISRKTNESNLRKWQKNLVSGLILAHLTQIWAAKFFFFFFFFFFRNLAWSVTRYHVQLSPCTISEKTNTPILRKLSDGRTDVWEWFHRVLSANVEHPTNSALLKTTILEECVNLQQPKLTVW